MKVLLPFRVFVLCFGCYSLNACLCATNSPMESIISINSSIDRTLLFDNEDDSEFAFQTQVIIGLHEAFNLELNVSSTLFISKLIEN
jgi:hypothetical protein